MRQSRRSVLKELKEHALRHDILISESEGVNHSTLYDAKQLVCEFRSMAIASGQPVAFNIAVSPVTGVMLLMAWTNTKYQSLTELEKSLE